MNKDRDHQGQYREEEVSVCPVPSTTQKKEIKALRPVFHPKYEDHIEDSFVLTIF